MKKETQLSSDNKNNYLISGGCFLLIVGAALLGRTYGWFGLDNERFWPTYLVLTGILFIFFTVQTRKSAFRGTFTWIGVFTILLGAFFYMFTYDIHPWRDMSYLWPSIILALGVATLASGYAGRKTKSKLPLVPGIMVTVLGAVLLALTTHGHSDAFLGKLWPIFIIIPGAALLSIGLRSHSKNPTK